MLSRDEKRLNLLFLLFFSVQNVKEIATNHHFAHIVFEIARLVKHCNKISLLKHGHIFFAVSLFRSSFILLQAAASLVIVTDKSLQLCESHERNE